MIVWAITLLIVALIWLIASIPVGILIGNILKGRLEEGRLEFKEVHLEVPRHVVGEHKPTFRLWGYARQLEALRDALDQVLDDGRQIGDAVSDPVDIWVCRLQEKRESEDE